MDMQFGKDGTFYLLTYGDGFFVANPDAGMYQWDYVAGERRRGPCISATPTSGAAPLTGAVLERGLARSGRERLDPVRVGLRRRRHGRLGRSEPVHTLHAERHLHRHADA